MQISRICVVLGSLGQFGEPVFDPNREDIGLLEKVKILRIFLGFCVGRCYK